MQRSLLCTRHKIRTELQSLTRTFLEQYPQSAFLATVYERAARSSFDLGDLTAGLSFAHQSLALFPENPLLLVATADVQARTGHPEAGLESAQRCTGLL